MPATRTVDIQPIIERQRIGRFWLGLFAVGLAVSFLDGFDLQIMSFVAHYIQLDFHLSDTQLGTISTLGVVGTLFGALIMGYLADHIGRRWTITIATLGFGIFMIALIVSRDYGQLIAFRVAGCFFIGAALPTMWALLTEFSPARMRATSVLIAGAGYSVGSAAGGPLSNLLIPRLGWQSVFVAGGVCSLLVVIPVVLILPESVKFLAQRDMKHDVIARIMHRIDRSLIFPDGTRFVLGTGPVDRTAFRPTMLFRGPLAKITPLVWLIWNCSNAVVFYLAFWGPILNERLGFSVSAAATLAAVTSLSGAVGQLIIARFVDRRGVGVLAYLPLVGLVCLLIIGLIPLNKPGYVVVLLVAYLAIIGAQGAMASLATIFYRPAIRANGASWASGVAKIGAMLGPLLAGVLMDGGLGTQGTFFVFALFPLLMSGMLLGVGRVQRRLRPEDEGSLQPLLARSPSRAEKPVA
jgi:MFS transporter, AAHS family, 4-hydroxybenzoate transporter